MIVTYNWLREFVDFQLSPEELAHRLTMAGLEVDAMEKIGEGLDSVIVARLDSVEPHPEADRLTLCTVNTGSETLPVVCGARNHRAGDLVALAQVGSVLPGDFRIKKSKIRGRESMGMLCSEKELGLAEEAEGILILPAGLPLGQPVFQALGLKDVRFELGLTPNRADCLSIIGVAREISAMVGQPLRLPVVKMKEEGAESATLTSVTINDPELCPRYAARLIEGVTIAPSPTWLVRRLETLGMRSINNVVDVTNLILMELGHPLHAFDFDLLRGRRIIVRRASEGEIFTTLDSQTRALKNTDLTICDGEGPVALAGIMGGENSEIRQETTSILLESAYFNPQAIRRTSKRLGLHTESSHRFERGADIDMVPFALDRAAALILDLAGGKIARGRIDAYPQPVACRQVSISPRRTEEILGLRLPAAEIGRLLRGIGLEVAPAGEGEGAPLEVKVPTFRGDLEREIDLIEEVARLNGYENIPVTMPVGRALCNRPPASQQILRRTRDRMVAAGFSEVINYSFVSEDFSNLLALADDDPRRQTVRILNPLTEEQAVMRTTLVPSLLETAARNLAYRTGDLRLFELRPVFSPYPCEELPAEVPHLTALMCGRRAPEGWAQTADAVDFFDLKGVAEALFDHLRIGPVQWGADSGEPFLHPGKSAVFHLGERRLGTVGEVHPRVLEVFGIDRPVFLLDVDLSQVFIAAGGIKPMNIQPLSRFPDISRDSAFLVAEEVTAAQIFAVLEKVRSRDVEDVVLFDIYRGKGIPAGRKSMAIRVRYRSMDKTLTDEEINRAHNRLVEALQRNLAAELR